MAARRARLVAQGVAIGLVGLLFVLLVWALVHDEGGDLAASAARGEKPAAPDFTLERLSEDGELTLSSLRGKAVVVNMWASYCAPCKEEAPFLERVWQDNRERGLVVVGVDTQDLRSDGREFVDEYRLTFPMVFDGPGDLWGPYGIKGLPETFVVDRDGKVVDAIVGGINTDEDRERLKAAVTRALAS